MTSEKAKKIKAIVKGVSPKDTFGTNPKEPWSAKYNVAESKDLEKYLKSRGINPAFVGTDSKIAHSKSGEFAKWKRDHQFEEVQTEQTGTTRHTPTEVKQHELLKKKHKQTEIGDVKTEAWDQPDYNQSIKARQAEADKKNKEQSKEGVNKLLTTYRAKNKKEHHVQEEVDKKDTVTMDIPFLIRILELTREDIKSDADLHRVVEKLIEIRNKGTLTMDDYDFVAKLKEEVDELDIPVLENEEMWASRVLDEGKMGQLSADIGQHIDKHVDEYKSTGGAEHLMSKIDHTAKKIAAQHGLEHKHARKFVSDYVEKKLHEETLDEVSDSTLDKAWHGRYQQALAAKHGSPEHQKSHKSMGKISDVLKKRTSDKLINMAKNDPEAYKKSAVASAEQDRKRGWSTEERVCPICGQTPCNCTHISEDVFQDSQAATQTVFDGATNTEDTTQNRKREMSKSARMIKALYKKHKVVKEEMFDHEKEDKSVATYGKKPKLSQNDPDSGENGGRPQSAATLSGGTTLTGEKRDTIEIDPMLQRKVVTPEGQDDQEGKDKKKSKQ